jgi:anti-anti-sigma factor
MTPDYTAHAPSGFRVHTYEAESWKVVECHGRLTSQNAPLLREEVRSLVPQCKHILMDLKEVPMIDSSGLGTIVALYVSARTRGCQIRLNNANQQIRDLFRMANLLSLFELAGRHHGKTL